MRVFIFGAGASRASQTHRERLIEGQLAPLVDELFNETYLPHSQRLGIRPVDLKEYGEMVKVSGGSLENWLTNKWARLGSVSELHQHAERAELGKLTFYIWFVLRSVSATYDEDNLYRVFMKKLKNKDYLFSLINFNYDVLLDWAIEDIFGVVYRHYKHYFSGSPRPVYIKPHGSVNWLLGWRGVEQLFTATRSSNGNYINAANYMFTAEALHSDSWSVIAPADLERELEKLFPSDTEKPFDKESRKNS